jgi:hypothetical protein
MCTSRKRLLVVRSAHGEPLELDYFQQALVFDEGGRVLRQHEWARDEAGRWYSLDPDQTEVTESRSGMSFRIKAWLRARNARTAA